MGLFDWVMKGIGFEPEEEPESYINQADVDASGEPIKKSRKELRRERKEAKRLEKLKRNQEAVEPTEPTDYNFTNTFSAKQLGEDDLPEGFGAGLPNSVDGYGTKNFVFFQLTCYEDVKQLIEYLRENEPAIIDLNEITESEAQRILDFASGAICALNGSIQRITGNIFLLVPDGFKITKPQSNK